MRSISTSVAVRRGVLSFAVAACAASAHAGFGAPEFGQLSYGGNPIAMTSGTGVGNDGYHLNRSGVGASELLIGLKAHEYRTGNNPDGTSTVSALSGGGSWLNLDASGAYTGLAGVATNTPSWNPNAPRWGFTWSISVDGLRPTAGFANMSVVITRPDAVAVTVVESFDAGSDFSAGNMAWQNNWNLGYLGVFGNGVDANTQGDWKIRIAVFSGATVYGAQEITVRVVPAPGAFALIGAAALGRRRRR